MPPIPSDIHLRDLPSLQTRRSPGPRQGRLCRYPLPSLFLEENPREISRHRSHYKMNGIKECANE